MNISKIINDTKKNLSRSSIKEFRKNWEKRKTENLEKKAKEEKEILDLKARQDKAKKVLKKSKGNSFMSKILKSTGKSKVSNSGTWGGNPFGSSGFGGNPFGQSEPVTKKKKQRGKTIIIKL